MSAALSAVADASPRVQSSLDVLAPGFARKVRSALARCDELHYEARVYETQRSRALAALYFSRGRTIKPPERPVTYAADETYTWHGYGCAVDVIHREFTWFDNAAARARWPDIAARARAAEEWYASVARVFKSFGCKWGGDWVRRDMPHFQEGACKPSPSDRARELLRVGGVVRVWQVLGVAA